jgi:pimeloyl-ACP methyl ester carboxylesterase
MKHVRSLFLLFASGSLAVLTPLALSQIAVPVSATGAIRHAASEHFTRDSQDIKPTIVLVHGAWADASSWNGVIPVLQGAGYTVVAPPNTLRGIPHDSAVLANYLKTIAGPIVLVAHSYGGAVITNAATGNPNIKELVYIDAFMPAQGETVGQLLSQMPGSCVLANPSDAFTLSVDPFQPAGDPDAYLNGPASGNYIGFDQCFANSLTRSEAALLEAVQRPIAVGALSEQSGVPAWSTIRSWSLIGTRDHVIPPAELTFMAKRAGSQIEYVTAGHASLIAQPLQVAKFIARAAQSAN